MFFSLGKKVTEKVCDSSPIFVCSHLATKTFIVVKLQFEDVKLTASSNNLSYFAMGPSPVSSRTRLFNHLLPILISSELFS